MALRCFFILITSVWLNSTQAQVLIWKNSFRDTFSYLNTKLFSNRGSNSYHFGTYFTDSINKPIVFFKRNSEFEIVNHRYINRIPEFKLTSIPSANFVNDENILFIQNPIIGGDGYTLLSILDTNFNILNSRYFNFSYNDFWTNILTENNQIFLYTNSCFTDYSTSLNAINLIKINVDLNPIFYKIYFNNEYLQANFRNFNLANDKILFIGKTINPVSGQLKTFFISTDTLGNIINQTLYPCQNDHNPNIICESKASNFIIIGSKSFPNANDVADISITKINEEGKVLLSKYIGGIGSDYISNIQSPFVYQNDTLYFLARTTSFSNDGLERPLLIKMDVNGNLLKAVLIMDTVSVGFYQELSFSKFDSTLLIISSAVFNNSGGHEYSRLITTNLNLRGICNSIDVTDSLHEFNFDQSWEAGNFQMANLNWDFVDAGIGIDSFPIVEKLVCFCNATSLFSFQQNSTGKEVQFTNTSQHCDYYEWHFGDGSTSTDENPMHVYEDTGTYSVWLVAYNDSCRDTTWHTLEVKGEYLEVTNAFSPNDDGVNDFWELKNRGIVSFSVSILNRWGSLVFESNDVSKSWDGKLKGQNVVSGTYFYVIKAKGISGKSYDTKGFLEVLK